MRGLADYRVAPGLDQLGKSRRMLFGTVDGGEGKGKGQGGAG